MSAIPASGCYNTEEKYDEIVKEVLRRIEKNDLFMKLEKCV